MTTMFHNRIAVHAAAVILFVALAGPHGLRAAMPESQRMERAKDLIADEQWARAVDELKAAAADPKEANKDEALFWLAHSQNQSRDFVGAVETIRRLERDVSGEPLGEAGAVAANRDRAAAAAQRRALDAHLPAGPAGGAGAAGRDRAKPRRQCRRRLRSTRRRRRGARSRPGCRRPPEGPGLAPTAVPPTPVPPPPSRAPGRMRAPMAPGAQPPPPPPPPPLAMWVPEGYMPDTDLRIQALGSLIRTDGAKVIPMLKEIALKADRPNQSRRALFVLVQSGRPEARSTVVDVAKTGPETVRIAAVRELGRFGGSGVSNDLLQVYPTGTVRVKYQVVTSLGSRDDAVALLKIAQSETDRELRDMAIVTLGQAGGGEQLFVFYNRAPSDAKRPIIKGLFYAQADEYLIRIAERERDQPMRREVLTRLRQLGTPKAMEYVEKAERK